jgi:hypothetical protein
MLRERPGVVTYSEMASGASRPAAGAMPIRYSAGVDVFSMVGSTYIERTFDCGR